MANDVNDADQSASPSASKRRRCNSGTLSARTGRPIVFAALLVGAFHWNYAALAQELDSVDDGALPPGTRAPADQQFDTLAFGENTTADDVKRTLGRSLNVRVKTVDRLCELSSSQRQKLELAGRGDISRFLHRVERKRAEYKRAVDPGAVRKPEDVENLIRDIPQFQLVLVAGPFGEGSLFAKITQHALDPSASAKVADFFRAERLTQDRQRVDKLIDYLSRALRLVPEQRAQFRALYLEETDLPPYSGRYDSAILILRAARAPEEKLRQILDDNQWQLLQIQFTAAKEVVPDAWQNDVDGPDDAEPSANAAKE